jgi:plastocyanin
MTNQRSLLSAVGLMTVIGLAFALLSVVPSASATSIVGLDDIDAGDLVRGESYSAVYYYGTDGFRYVFPNDKAYFTWYDNFDDVKWISDSDLSDIQIGGNVTYKPGSKMIKINSDPTVYVVSAGGVIRGIPSEAVASELYGSNWNQQIDDVPDGFFPNYTMGSELEFAASFSPSAESSDAFSINADKDLEAYTTVSVTEDGYSPSSITIDAGQVIRFENEGTGKHSASDDDSQWGTGTMISGENFSRYFDEAGTYTYHDAYDDGLAGTIIVE